jgi:hypothetical protein
VSHFLLFVAQVFQNILFFKVISAVGAPGAVLHYGGSRIP